MYRDNQDVVLARKVAAICGQKHEVITTGTYHAMTVLGHQDLEEVRARLRENLKDEAPIGS